MTNFFRVALRPPDSSPSCRSGSSPQNPGQPPSWDDEPGFELITCVSDGVQHYVDWTLFKADTTDQILPVCFLIQGVELGPRPQVSRGPPLDQWEEFLDPQGRVQNPERVKELVFRGVRMAD